MKTKVLGLLMDVTPLERATISRAFKPSDFEVVWSSNLSEALEASARQRVDLLLLDLNRPVRVGWEILDRMTTLHPGTPLIIITDDKRAYEGAVTRVATALLQKPFNVAALAHAANVLLGNSSPGVAPPVSQDLEFRDLPAKSKDFRGTLYQRYSAPYALPLPSYRHWGINE